MNTNDDLQPINRNYILVGVVLVIIFSTVIWGAINSITNTKPTTTVSAPNPIVIDNENGNGKGLDKYNEDSDDDKIPNFAEEILSLSPYASEISECQLRNPLCDKNPVESVNNIIFLVDASSSMNIIGKKESKINEIKSSLVSVMKNNLNKPYYQISIVSLGNKGNRNFIPDNESCTSFRVNKLYANTPEQFASDTTFVANGKSPIAYSVEQLSKSINKQTNNLLIIITDGLDDCNGDVNGAIKNAIGSGAFKRVDAITYFANEDANNYFKEVIEANSGKFSANPELEEIINDKALDFVKSNWCRTEDNKKLTRCIEDKYQRAINFLNEQKGNKNLSMNEVDRIGSVQNSLSIFLRNTVQTLNNRVDETFNNFINPKRSN